MLACHQQAAGLQEDKGARGAQQSFKAERKPLESIGSQAGKRPHVTSVLPRVALQPPCEMATNLCLNASGAGGATAH